METSYWPVCKHRWPGDEMQAALPNGFGSWCFGFGSITSLRAECYTSLKVKTCMQQGKGDGAFVCERGGFSLGRMPSPAQLSPCTFLSALKKCRIEKDLSLALRLHVACMHDPQFLITHPSLGDQLILVLVEFGSMSHAQEVFDFSNTHKQASWDALITGYAKKGKFQHAISLYKKRHEYSTLCPSGHSYVALLKACGALQELELGSILHEVVASSGLLDGEIFVGSALLEMYIKFGSLDKAQEVFDSLPVVDVVSWTILMAGYVDHGFGTKAYCCYERMQNMCISPDILTFACVLRACGSISATGKGMKVHTDIVKKGFQKQPLVGNALVDMYAKCGLLESALEVFNNLPVKDTGSWNALIVGYINQNIGAKALYLFDQMQRKGVPLDTVTFVQSLKACCMAENDLKGRQLHTQIVQKGCETDILVSSTLVHMYAKGGSLVDAQAVFNRVASPNEVLYNSLLSGYLEHNFSKEALTLFESMQDEGRPVSTITFVLGLQSCSSARDISKGQEMHITIVKKGMEGNLLVSVTIVSMYSKCGAFFEAHGVFDKLLFQDVVSWTSLMSGYLEHGHNEEVLDCYDHMQHDCVCLNAIACMCVLKACGNLGSAGRGLSIHADMISKGLDSEVSVGNSLVEMYSKSGWLVTAQFIFDSLRFCDPIAYNALISGYLEKGAGDMALACLEQLKLRSVYVNAATLVCCLKACGSIGSTSKGQWIHMEIVARGLDDEVLLIKNTLIDMYSKCGLLKEALTLFQELPARSVVSWTAVISGYAQVGKCEIVLNILHNMIEDGTAPNLVTCVSVLNACSHAGLISEGCLFFEFMSCELGYIPIMEHYTCIVDMFGRIGRVDKAIYILLDMPMQPSFIAWQRVMGACQTWGGVERGRYAFEHSVEIGRSDAASYVYMHNIYANASRD